VEIDDVLSRSALAHIYENSKASQSKDSLDLFINYIRQEDPPSLTPRARVCHCNN
jgi:hypothetical protein